MSNVGSSCLDIVNVRTNRRYVMSVGTKCQHVGMSVSFVGMSVSFVGMSVSNLGMSVQDVKKSVPIVMQCRDVVTFCLSTCYSFVRAYKALERENQLDGVDVIPKEEYQRCMMEYKTKHGVRAWLDLMKQHRLHVDSCSQKQKFLKAVLDKRKRKKKNGVSIPGAAARVPPFLRNFARI